MTVNDAEDLNDARMLPCCQVFLIVRGHLGSLTW